MLPEGEKCHFCDEPFHANSKFLTFVLFSLILLP